MQGKLRSLPRHLVAQQLLEEIRPSGVPVARSDVEGRRAGHCLRRRRLAGGRLSGRVVGGGRSRSVTCGRSGTVASPTLTLASVPATPDASRTPTPACLFAARRTRLASSDLQSERTTHLTADARPPSTARREAHSRECQKDCLGNRPHPALGGCGASYRLACRRPTQQGSRTQGSAGSFRRRRAGHPS